METNENAQGPEAQKTSTPVQDNTLLMSVLSYIGFLVLIPLLTAKDNEVVKFHVRQGLVLLVIEVGVLVVSEMVYPLSKILSIINFGALILSIVGIVNVTQKKQVPLPLVGQFSKYFNI